MSVRDIVLRVLPRRYLLPLRYQVRRLRATLEREMRLLPILAAPGRVAVDIGANDGIYCYALSRLGAWVEAFEPVPSCADLIEGYGAPNVRVHRVALSSASGRRDLNIPLVRGRLKPSRASFSRSPSCVSTLSVPVAPLDAFDLRDVSFIKIDVEGHELEVLRGARGTIKREAPNVLIEVEQRQLDHPMQTVFDLLEGWGFRGFFLKGRQLLPLSEFSLPLHQRASGGEAVPREYINNFIFRP